MNSAQYYSAKDIAHRWFAYFEGTTEPLDDHLAMFSDNIRLVHAGTHVLVNNLPSLKAWLKSVPEEVSAHFIDSFQFEPLDQHSAKVSMSVRYQAVDHPQRLIGAVIDYQTEVEFDQYNNARFRFIQKTPIQPNPDSHFSPSFELNRIESLRSHLLYCFHQNQTHQGLESSTPLANRSSIATLVTTLSSTQLATLPMTFGQETAETKHINVAHNQQRYVTIHSINL